MLTRLMCDSCGGKIDLKENTGGKQNTSTTGEQAVESDKERI